MLHWARGGQVFSSGFVWLDMNIRDGNTLTLSGHIRDLSIHSTSNRHQLFSLRLSLLPFIYLRVVVQDSCFGFLVTAVVNIYIFIFPYFLR